MKVRIRPPISTIILACPLSSGTAGLASNRHWPYTLSASLSQPGMASLKTL